MKKYLFVIYLFSYISLLSARDNLSGKDTLNLNHWALINVNKFSVWARSDGLIARSPGYEKNSTYPERMTDAIFSDGFVWAGFVHDSRIPPLRAGGSLYISGLTTGKILPDGTAEEIDKSVRTIWNIRKDWETADLSDDANRVFNLTDRKPTEEEINKIRSVYEDSWQTWPWQKGAPFYDENNNGIMDPGEKPGLLGADQVVWFVCNDIDQMRCGKFLGSPHIGIELQVTLWAYNSEGSELEKSLNQTLFRCYRFIYKGTDNTPDSARIDSMFISMWSDCDIGNNTDDYVGCDTLLDLMFTYNSTFTDEQLEEYNLPPYSIGYTLLQGPVVFTGNASDRGSGVSGEKTAFRNLQITSFNYFRESDLISECSMFRCWGIYAYTVEWYNLMNGLQPRSGRKFKNALGEPDVFPFSDDPVTSGRDVDGVLAPAGERRMQFHSGPFSMALGDTQDVVIATVGGIGSDRLASVSVMKYWTRWVRYFYKYDGWEDIGQNSEKLKELPVPMHFSLNQNYPNPFNSTTNITFSIPLECSVSIDIYNSAGKYIVTLMNKTLPSGNYSVTWNASGMPSGLYFCKMRAGQVTRAVKMLLVR